MTDDGLKSLRKLPLLTTLVFGSDGIGAIGAKHLNSIEGLQLLLIDGETFTIEGWEELGKSLRAMNLHLRNIRLTQERAMSLRSPRGLVKLSLEDCSLNPGAMNCFRNQTQLFDFTVHNSDLTDDDIDAIVTFPSMSHLVIVDTQVTDSGLETLAKCKQLKYLEVSGKRITSDGLKRFRSSRRDLNVVEPQMVGDR